MQHFHIHRFEFKYLLSVKQYHSLKEDVLNYANYDNYCMNNLDRSYFVYSLYFDSLNHANFWEKVDGISNRNKFRLRIYNIDPNAKPDIYLEIKRKINSVIVKDRAVFNFNDFKTDYRFMIDRLLINNTLPIDQKKVLDEFAYYVLKYHYKPTVLVEYKREAFFGKYHSNIRITFDSNIKSYRADSLFSDNKIPDTVLAKEILMELKFNGLLPSWFHHLIQKYDLNREAHSKYCNSMIKTFKITI